MPFLFVAGAVGFVVFAAWVRRSDRFDDPPNRH
jgi:hypothetical protein